MKIPGQILLKLLSPAKNQLLQAVKKITYQPGIYNNYRVILIKNPHRFLISPHFETPHKKLANRAIKFHDGVIPYLHRFNPAALPKASLSTATSHPGKKIHPLLFSEEKRTDIKPSIETSGSKKLSTSDKTQILQQLNQQGFKNQPELFSDILLAVAETLSYSPKELGELVSTHELTASDPAWKRAADALSKIDTKPGQIGQHIKNKNLKTMVTEGRLYDAIEAISTDHRSSGSMGFLRNIAIARENQIHITATNPEPSPVKNQQPKKTNLSMTVSHPSFSPEEKRTDVKPAIEAKLPSYTETVGEAPRAYSKSSIPGAENLPPSVNPPPYESSSKYLFPLYAGNTNAQKNINDKQLEEVLLQHVFDDLSKKEGRTDKCIALANAFNVPVERFAEIMNNMAKNNGDPLQGHCIAVADSIKEILSTSPLTVRGAGSKAFARLSSSTQTGSNSGLQYKEMLASVFGTQVNRLDDLNDFLGLAKNTNLPKTTTSQAKLNNKGSKEYGSLPTWEVKRIKYDPTDDKNLFELKDNFTKYDIEQAYLSKSSSGVIYGQAGYLEHVKQKLCNYLDGQGYLHDEVETYSPASMLKNMGLTAEQCNEKDILNKFEEMKKEHNMRNKSWGYLAPDVNLLIAYVRQDIKLWNETKYNN